MSKKILEQARIQQNELEDENENENEIPAQEKLPTIQLGDDEPDHSDADSDEFQADYMGDFVSFGKFFVFICTVIEVNFLLYLGSE